MAKAKKRSNGSWRVQVYDHTEIVDGKKKLILKSFTEADPTPAGRRRVEARAASWAESKKRLSGTYDLTLGDAMIKHDEIKKEVLSPTTYRNYLGYESNKDFDIIKKIHISDLTDANLQEWISHYSVGRSPKSVKNAYGYITSVISLFAPDLHFHVKLPQKVSPDLYIPSDKDIKTLLASIRGTELEKAVLLGTLGLRMSEVCGLTIDDLDGTSLSIRQVKVYNGNGFTIKQTAKNDASRRTITIPSSIACILGRNTSDYIVDVNPHTLSDQFNKAVAYAGLPHFRFHDLRHYFASQSMVIGIPLPYIAKMGGWAPGSTALTKIYAGVISAEEQKFIEKSNEFFGKFAENTKKKSNGIN